MTTMLQRCRPTTEWLTTVILLQWWIQLGHCWSAGSRAATATATARYSRPFWSSKSSQYAAFVFRNRNHITPIPRKASEASNSENAKDEESSFSSSPWSDYYKPLDEAILNRRACKAFWRSDGTQSSSLSGSAASQADPAVIRVVKQCLELARLAPSAFNVQPYRILLVYENAQKLAMAKYCLGPNRQRVLDADCTVVFLADKQILKTARRFAQFMQRGHQSSSSRRHRHRPLPKITFLYLAIFSSGYPLPRVLSSTVSFLLRTAIGFTDWLLRNVLRTCKLPSLSSAETWSAKQVTMVAMSYMLACSSRGLDTIPMEGFNAPGICRVLKIPRGRYAIPLIVSTGTALHDDNKNQQQEREQPLDRRYPVDEVVFDNVFGQA